MSSSSSQKKKKQSGGRRAQARELAEQHPEAKTLGAMSTQEIQEVYSLAFSRITETDVYTKRIKGLIWAILAKTGFTQVEQAFMLTVQLSSKQKELEVKVNMAIELIIQTDWSRRLKDFPQDVLTMMMFWNTVLVRLYEKTHTETLGKVREVIWGKLTGLGLIVEEIPNLSRYCDFTAARPKELEVQVQQTLNQLISKAEEEEGERKMKKKEGETTGATSESEVTTTTTATAPVVDADATNSKERGTAATATTTLPKMSEQKIAQILQTYNAICLAKQKLLEREQKQQQQQEQLQPQQKKKSKKKGKNQAKEDDNNDSEHDPSFSSLPSPSQPQTFLIDNTLKFTDIE